MPKIVALISCFLFLCFKDIHSVNKPVMRKNPQIESIGIPVKAVTHVVVKVGSSRKGKAQIYAAMAQQADNFILLAIDPETGRFRRFIPGGAESNYPNAPMMSKTGRLYIGAAYSGHLFYFDPDKERLIDCGLIHPGSTFPCAIDEDAEGRIWIGSYGDADLTRYDPGTGVFTPYGRMDEVDMYNAPVVNADGMICNSIGTTRPHLVVLDPKTGERRTVGPVTTKGNETFALIKGADKWVYIESSLGNFRVEGFQTHPIAEVPRAPGQPAGFGIASVSFVDGPELIFRKLQVKTTNGKTRLFNLDYQGAGTDIFLLHRGPDDLLYGSSILPLHLFRYHPERRELRDFGRCTVSTGEAYSMANLDKRLYISSYTAARISVYDPSKAYAFGEKAGDNPRDLGRIDEISYRPRSTLTGPLGRVWVASIPDYGMWGGPLSWYDPSADTKKAYYRIAGDASCYTLAHLGKQELIAVGTTIQGGTGTQPRADKGVLFLWDYRAEKKTWEGSLDRPVSAFNALVTDAGGKLWGTVTGGEKPELFVFDPDSRKFTGRFPLPEGEPLDLGLQLGPDGRIYGFTRSCFYCVDPDSFRIEPILTAPDGFDVPGPIIGKDVFFATRHFLKAIRIFD
jgi:streptogramin lyase